MRTSTIHMFDGVVRRLAILAAILAAVLAAVLAATVVGPATAVHAATTPDPPLPPEGVYYELRNNHTDKCADVANASKSWNAVVHQWTCHRQAHQLWTAHWISTSGNVQLRNKNSQFCLAAGFPYYEGQVVRQLDCTLDDSRGLGNVWTPIVEGGTVKLVHYYSALAGWNPPLCLDLDRGSRSDGAKIQLLRCASDSNAQNWYFT